MAYKYKSKSGSDFFIPGIGTSVNGVLTTDIEVIGCPSIELIVDQPQVQATPIAQPNAVIGVAPQATAESQPIINNALEVN